jgi:hypothetical protein
MSMNLIVSPYPVIGGGGGPTILPTTNILYEHRGSDLAVGNNNGITSWVDHQPTANHLNASSLPVQRDNTLNGLPTAEFGGAAQMNLANAETVSAFSYVALMKCNDGGTRTLMAGNGGSPQVRIDGNKIQILKATIALIGTSTTTLSTSTYYTVAVTYDGTNYVFYLNGVADGSGSNAQTFADPVRYLGASVINAERFFGNVALQALYGGVWSPTDRADVFTAVRNLGAHY